jgi:hypothetical protein
MDSPVGWPAIFGPAAARVSVRAWIESSAVFVDAERQRPRHHGFSSQQNRAFRTTTGSFSVRISQTNSVLLLSFKSCGGGDSADNANHNNPAGRQFIMDGREQRTTPTPRIPSSLGLDFAYCSSICIKRRREKVLIPPRGWLGREADDYTATSPPKNRRPVATTETMRTPNEK